MHGNNTTAHNVHSLVYVQCLCNVFDVTESLVRTSAATQLITAMHCHSTENAPW